LKNDIKKLSLVQAKESFLFNIYFRSLMNINTKNAIVPKVTTEPTIINIAAILPISGDATSFGLPD